jgi:hypothetical protein
MTKMKVCRICEGGIMDPSFSHCEPVYVCRNCSGTAKRKIYDTRQRRERKARNAEIERMFEQLTGQGPRRK